RLTVLGPVRVAPVRHPDGAADDKQSDGDAERVLPVVRLDADDGRLRLLGQSPQQPARADRPRRERDQGREVGVEAAYPCLAIGLLRARVALKAPADEEPCDAEDEDLRAGAG